ncbi:14586_t:CDS:2, partial [Entrophospora sp. SA101]
LPAASGIFNVEDKEIKSLLKSEEYEIFSNINLPFHEVPENSANYLLTLAKKISSTQELCHYLATMPWGDEVYNIEMHYNLRDSLDQILLLFEDTPKPHKLMVWGISHCELSGIIYGMDNPFGLDYYRLFTFGRYNLPSSFSNIGDLLMSIKLLLQLK